MCNSSEENRTQTATHQRERNTSTQYNICWLHFVLFPFFSLRARENTHFISIKYKQRNETKKKMAKRRPRYFLLKIHFNRNHRTHDIHLTFKFIGFAIHINNIREKEQRERERETKGTLFLILQFHYLPCVFLTGKHSNNNNNNKINQTKYDGNNNNDDDDTKEVREIEDWEQRACAGARARENKTKEEKNE